MGARGHSSAHRLIDVPGKGRQGVPKGGFGSPASADRISGLASRRSWLMYCSANVVRGEALSKKPSLSMNRVCRGMQRQVSALVQTRISFSRGGRDARVGS